jgi:uncharacterized protein (TIGR00730 family)
MGVLADAALAAGGEVMGVVPHFMAKKELVHPGLSGLQIVPSWRELNAVMANLAEAFIAVPGGCDTLAEFFEPLTWSALGRRPKPWELLNVAGYYNSLLGLLAHIDAEQFINPGGRAMIWVEQDVAKLLDQIAQSRSQVIHRDCSQA